jgi:hypothetical protein
VQHTNPVYCSLQWSIGGVSCHSKADNVDTELIVEADIHDPEPEGDSGCAALEDLLNW